MIAPEAVVITSSSVSGGAGHAPAPTASASQQQQQAPSPAASSSFKGPILHCMICQCKLELHPSLFGPLEDASEGASSFATKSSSARYYDGSDEKSDGLAAELEHRLDLMSGCSLVGCSQSGNLLELIAESGSPMEVPMCKKCASAISSELNKQLAQLEQECVQYKQSLNQLLKRRAECPFDREAARHKLDSLKSDEQDLLEQLTLLEEEERSLTSELEVKQAEQKKISERDEELYRRLRNNHRTLIEQADEQRSLKLQIKQTYEQIQRLSKMNVLDMVFHIWVDGEYGTISGFRLGRLRHDQVEWNEINAALGQMAFLLKVISERLGMEFSGYEVVPCASNSFIRVLKSSDGNLASWSYSYLVSALSNPSYSYLVLRTWISNSLVFRSTSMKTTICTRYECPSLLKSNSGVGEELPLYGTGGWRPFGQPVLDKALVAFMDCFCQVEKRLRQYFPVGTQLLPYRMLKDKIVDKDSQYLIRMQLNSEERWTKAMKCLLLNLKRVIGILITLPSLAAAHQQQTQSPSTAPPQQQTQYQDSTKSRTLSEAGPSSSSSLLAGSQPASVQKSQK